MQKSWLVAAGITVIVAAANFAAPSSAHAYQAAKVGPAGATLFAEPKSTAAKKGKLAAGASVNVLEPAHNGFYRATSGDGKSGWVLQSAVVINKSAAPAASTAQATPNPVPSAAPPAAAAPTTFDLGPPTVYVGALVGIGVAGGGSAISFGADLGYRVNPQWSLGGYFSYLNLQAATTTTTSAGTIAGASLMILAAELNYHVPAVPEFHFGVKAGVGTASGNALGLGAGSGSVSAFAGGGTAAYDYPVLRHLSLGLEADFFYVAGDIASTVFNGLGAIKYHF